MIYSTTNFLPWKCTKWFRFWAKLDITAPVSQACIETFNGLRTPCVNSQLTETRPLVQSKYCTWRLALPLPFPSLQEGCGSIPRVLCGHINSWDTAASLRFPGHLMLGCMDYPLVVRCRRSTFPLFVSRMRNMHCYASRASHYPTSLASV